MFSRKILIGDGKLTVWEVLVILLLGFTFWRSIEAAARKGYDSYQAKNYTEEQIYVRQIADDFSLRRYWDGRSYGTLWEHCGATVTADHVIALVPDNGAEYVGKTAHRNDKLADVIHYGEWDCKAPQELDEGQEVSIIGYPGGSSDPSMRQGSVYFKRSVSGSDGYATATWIIVFDTPEPVIGGMSGGIVVNSYNQAVGVLVVQNSPADLDGDGKTEHSADVVSLADYHRIVAQ